MRVLVGRDLGPGFGLRELYAAPDDPWLRVNMVSTLDGSATGDDGLSGGINNDADKRVFDVLRSLADAVVAGAGTIRAEEYDVPAVPMVVVSRGADVPPTMRGAEPGRVLMATTSTAGHLDEARDLLGADHVLLLGSHRVDLRQLRHELAGRGLTQLLCEGGPHLLRDLLDQGCVDELDVTVVPRVVAGEHPRITTGPPVDVPLRLHTLLESEHTLLARWLT